MAGNDAPICIHPQNNKLFLFRGKPLVLLTATEHYGAVINRPFRFERYLADLAVRGITLTRLFILFRELQTPINPYSPCKPETPDYVAPFERTGPGRALDGELKYDLDRPNGEFFARLHDFLSCASDHGIVVEVVLLSNTYGDPIWELNPFHSANNVNSMKAASWPEYTSMRHEDLFTRQAAHVRRIVEEINHYDNVIIEICNEPGGDFDKLPGSPTREEVNAWLDALITVVRETEAALPRRHLVAGQEAFSYSPWVQPTERSFAEMDYDVVNIHPLPNTTYAGSSFDMGDFMSKQLKLRAVRDFGQATYAEAKPLCYDEDNVASQYKDHDGWTIHRKRAWTTLFTGNHYDYIDFSIIPLRETGTEESRRHIRAWVSHLSRFMHSLDLIHSKPLRGVVRTTPPYAIETAFGVPEKRICVYLCDEREIAAARGLPDSAAPSPDAGAPIEGTVVLDLPHASYRASLFDPQTGLSSPSVTIDGGPNTQVQIPPFVHDVLLDIKRS